MNTKSNNKPVNHGTLPKKRERSKGFTLIELLATLVVIGILLALAVPASRHFLTQNRADAELNTFLSELNYGRNTAISQNQKTVLCPSVDHKSCGGSWREAHIITNADGKIMRVFDPLSKEDNLIWKSSGVDKNGSITWLPTGYTNGQRGTFYYCVARAPAHSHTVTLSDTGRFYTNHMTDEIYQNYCGK